MVEPEKLIGKRIAYNTVNSVAHGVVTAVAGSGDAVYAEWGWGKYKKVSKVSVSDIVKVYEKGS